MGCPINIKSVMENKSQIKKICLDFNLQPKRRLGQNFLISKNVLEKIIKTADLKKDDLVLEVGSGLGFLTEELAKRVKKVLAIEIDKNLVEVLKERLRNYENVEIIKEDIFSEEARKIILKWLKKEKKYKIVANLPYNITSRFLRIFLSAKIYPVKSPAKGSGAIKSQFNRARPELMVLMIQKEVAQRIISKPPQMSKLSVMVQFYSQPEIVFKVKKENFWPKPKVESAILRLVLFERERIYPVKCRQAAISPKAKLFHRVNEDKFFKIVRAGFLSPRKYLLNNLKKAELIKENRLRQPASPELQRGEGFGESKGEKIFKELGFSPKIRAQELRVKDWEKLCFTI